MIDTRYLTIAEYAERRGISKQRVYQLLEKDLKEFVVEIKGKKYIDISAFPEDEKIEFEQRLKQFDSSRISNLNKLQQEVEWKKLEIEELKKTISKQEEMIMKYQAMIAEKDRHIMEQAGQLATFTAKAQELASQAQTIASQAQFLQLNDRTKALEENPAEAHAEAQEASPEEPKKKSWFARLFE